MDVRKNLPQCGCRGLYYLCLEYFGAKFTLGRDRFYDVLRANGMMLRRKRFKPRTTNSLHPYKIYSDLLNTQPKFVPSACCRLVVADITYVSIADGFAYLSLLTDGYSRCIVGFCLHPTLETVGPMEALQMALEFYQSHQIEVQGLIHHSDRGVQYASKEYVSTLQDKGILMSMTQTGAPLHNALAERMNNTIKNGWLYDYGDKTFDQALRGVAEAIYRYNWMRPHQANSMRTPMQMMPGEHPNPLLVGSALGQSQPKGERIKNKSDKMFDYKLK